MVDTRQELWLGGVDVHHGVPFCSAKVCSPAIFETCFSYDKDIWFAATDYYYALLCNCANSIGNYCQLLTTPINKFYSFIFFS